MPSARDSAYPRLKSNPSSQELSEVYTPSESELTFAAERTRQSAQRVGLLLLLKTFQRLGYFVRYAQVPAVIVRHISRCVGVAEVPAELRAYDTGTARDRHTKLIREFLGVNPYGPAARAIVEATCRRAARTRDDLPDIINMAIEELIRQRYELPAYSTL